MAISRGQANKKRHRADIFLPGGTVKHSALHSNLTPANQSWFYTKWHSRWPAQAKCPVVILIALPVWHGVRAAQMRLPGSRAASSFVLPISPC